MEAIQNYKTVISLLSSDDNTSYRPQDTHSLYVLLSNILNLAASGGFNEEIENAKALFLEKITAFKDVQRQNYICISLIEKMLENPKHFKKGDFIGMESICEIVLQAQTSISAKIEIMGTCLRLAEKTGTDKNRWKLQIAQAYDNESLKREGGPNLVSIDFCNKAIKYYKKLGHTEKVIELNARYKRLKESMQFGVISDNIDITPIIDKIKNRVQSLMKEGPENIIQYLIHSPELFPGYKFIYDEVEKIKKAGSIQFYAGTSISDDWGNTAEHYTSDDELMHFHVMQGFGYYLHINTYFLTKDLFYEAIRQGKLTSLDLFIFMTKYTWLGQDITAKVSNTERTYNWAATCFPAINEFFGQFHFYFQNQINTPSHILTVDSLTLKLEGIVRDICELHDIPTFYQADDKKGRIIVREMDVNTLLYKEELVKIIHEDDLLLLRYVLIDKAGWNLRNRVAHALLRSGDDYSFQHVVILIICFLRLSKKEYGPLKHKITNPQ